MPVMGGKLWFDPLGQGSAIREFAAGVAHENKAIQGPMRLQHPTHNVTPTLDRLRIARGHTHVASDRAARGSSNTHWVHIARSLPILTMSALLLAAPAAFACVGDCDGGGSVTVDELITGVNIALGSAPLSGCQSLDRNGDAQVTIDELLVAVNQALLGCGDATATPTATPGVTVTPAGFVHQQFVTDAQGRALILHGINVTGSAKDDPLRMPWITQADAERVAHDWGFNVVRFLIFWDAAEPQPGQYDETYLDRVAERVAWFANVGVYVVLDMHQDVYGHVDSAGKPLGFDGAPSWAARTDGLPHQLVNPWSLTYIQPGVKRAFDNFWNDTGPNTDLGEHYAAMWAHIAARFKDQPGILGYDLMNEPFAGSSAAGEIAGLPFGSPALSKTFQETLFKRGYDRIIAAIRAVDPNGWIFYEPLALPANNGGASDLPKLTDPRSGENRLVYFPHFYAIIPELTSHYDPANTAELDDWIAQRSADDTALQVPMAIGEFGLPWDAGGDPLGYLQKVLNTADAITSGWAYWAYDPGNWAPITGPDLHESPNANILVRTYAQRVAGTPIRYAYDPATRVFDLTFADQAGVTGPTEIYLPARRFYASGWQLDVSDADATWTSTWDATKEILSVTTPYTAGMHQIHVSPMD